MIETKAFILGQITPQSVGLVANDHTFQIISLIIGAAIQIVTLFTSRKKRRAAAEAKKHPAVK